MADNSSGDFEGEDVEEDTNLLKESRTKKDDGGLWTGSNGSWKILLSGLGVVVMVSLGVAIGATVSRRNDTASVGCAVSSNRLPSHVVPLLYRLYLHPNITNGKFDYTGNVRILLNVKSATDLIILHTKGLTLKSVVLYQSNDVDKIGYDIPTVRVTGSAECKTLEQLIIRLEKKLPSNSFYVLQIQFSGTISKLLDGFYRSSYKTSTGETRHLATSHFEPASARTAFPCFDEPAMKAKYRIVIVREKQFISLSNMPNITTVKRQDGLYTDFFQESVKMSTYLVIFVVCDFGYLSAKTHRGTKIKVYAPIEKLDEVKFAIEVAPKVLEYYESFFQVNFPLPKLDLIAIPDFNSGACENWGLITYRLSSILYKEGESSLSTKQWIAEVIAHELAHQWFGNLVTMKWWNDLWLNEGFADFMDIVGTDHIFPKWKMKDQMLLKMVQRSMVLDSHLNSHPISVKVTNVHDAAGAFDTISYSKGASVVRMMKDFIGEKAFHAGLKHYLSKYQFRNAASDDLWVCLTKATGNKINVKKVMDTWILQMGYPVVTISKKGNMAVATQDHFITDSVKKETKISKFHYKWNIPMTYHFQHHVNKTRMWFHRDKTEVTFPWHSKSNGWLKVNCDQVGFYRVNYDQENWNAIIAQLNSNHLALSDGDRSNLLDDSFEFAKAGRRSYVQALELTPYLVKEKSYVPWTTGSGCLGYIGGMLKGLKEYKFYEKYMLKLAVPHISTLGWIDNGSHLDRFLRTSILRIAVAHNHTKSVKYAMDMFQEWKVKGKVNGKKISPNLRSTVYLAGLKYGDESNWNFMFQKFKTAKYVAVKKRLMYALAETSNTALLKKYLNMALDNSVIKSQDSTSLIKWISQNPANGLKMVIKFLKDHWKVIHGRYARAQFTMASLLKGVFSQIKTKEGLQMAEEFFNGRDLGSGKRAYGQILAIINNNIDWLKKNKKDVVDWFKKNI